LIIPDNNVSHVLTLADRYFDLEGLVVYSALSKTTLRRHIKENALPFYKLDGKIV